jgi:hypothetical protein
VDLQEAAIDVVLDTPLGYTQRDLELIETSLEGELL